MIRGTWIVSAVGEVVKRLLKSRSSAADCVKRPLRCSDRLWFRVVLYWVAGIVVYRCEV